jgi:hypothetical protein
MAVGRTSRRDDFAGAISMAKGGVSKPLFLALRTDSVVWRVESTIVKETYGLQRKFDRPFEAPQF